MIVHHRHRTKKKNPLWEDYVELHGHKSIVSDAAFIPQPSLGQHHQALNEKPERRFCLLLFAADIKLSCV